MLKKLTKTLILLTILLIPTYLIRFSIFGMPTNVLEILVLATFISAFLDRQKFNYKEFYEQNKAYLAGVILIFVGLVISTLINGEYQTGFGIIKGWFIVPLVFFWVLLKEIKKTENLQNVLKWLYLSISGVSIISLVYYFQGELTYDGRLAAFYASPNYLAMYLAPAIFVGVLSIKYHVSGIKNNIFSIKNYKLLLNTASLLMILTAFYFTYSYMAWLAVIASLIIIGLIKNKKINKRIILASLIILLLIIISQWNMEKLVNLRSYSRSSLESRIMIWKSSEKILSDNFIFGIGPGNFQNKYLEYQKYFPPYLEWAVPQPHNLYLAFWLEAGMLGLAGFAILIFKWLKDLRTLVKKQKNSADIAAVLSGIMLYILLHGLVDTTYWKNDLAMVFWVIFFLGLAVKKLDADPI